MLTMRTLVTLTLATAALLAACGGSDSTKNATPTTSSATTPPPAATTSVLAGTPIAASATPAAAATPTPAPSPPPAATESAPATTAPPPPGPTEAPPPPDGGATLGIAAVNVLFDTASLAAPAGLVTIVFSNQDTAIAHNIQFFAGSQSIGMTEIATGPDTQTLSLGTLVPGSYFYKCDVHPTTMKGSLTIS